MAWDYLTRNKKFLENREGGLFKDADWYRFGRSQNLGMWEQPKLMVPYMITNLAAYLDRAENYYFINVTTGGYPHSMAARFPAPVKPTGLFIPDMRSGEEKLRDAKASVRQS